MKRLYSNSIHIVRFRQWSRKGYAVFAGLHKNISIGHVSADICEKSLVKSSPFLAINNQNRNYDCMKLDAQDFDDEPADSCLLQLLESLQLNKEIAACQHLNNYYKTFNRRLM